MSETHFSKNRQEFAQFREGQKQNIKRAAYLDQAAGEPTGWNFYDEGESSFAISFKEVLKGKSLPDFLKSRFPNKTGELIMVEIGGPGYNLANDLKGLVKKSVSVCLTDNHLPLPNKIISPKLNHKVIEGDFSDQAVHRALAKEVKIEGVDFWVERFHHAWDFIVKNPGMLYHILRKNYRLMGPDSTMLTELWALDQNDIPLKREEMEAWRDSVNGKFSGKLQVDYNFPKELRIDKFPGAPKDLPTNKLT